MEVGNRTSCATSICISLRPRVSALNSGFGKSRSSADIKIRVPEVLNANAFPLRCGFLVSVPMDFQERIDGDIKEAMKAKEATRLGVLRMLKTALKNLAIEQGGAAARLDDASALAVLRKELKKRQDSIEGFSKGGREDLAAKEREESLVLEAYLPKQLSTQEVDALVESIIKEVGATSKAQMGQVMKLAAERAAGRADGRALSSAIGARLT